MRVPWFDSLPLSIRVPLVTAGLMALLGVVASQGVLAVLGHVQDARLREIARLHVDGLSVAVAPFVPRQDAWEVYDILDRSRSAYDGQRPLLTVVGDERGRVLAATDPQRAAIGAELGAFETGAVPPEDVRMTGAALLRVVQPLSYQGRRVGKIVAELDVSDLLAERRRVMIWLLLGNTAATVVLALAGWLVVARQLRPVRLLIEAMDRAQGAPRPIPAASIPTSDPSVARLIETYNEMTEAVAARSEAERRLADRERFVSLGRMSSSLAHEINNPLGGLLNATDTILTYSDRPEVVRKSGELLLRGLSHMRVVARAILDQNRLDRAGLPLRTEDFDDLRLLFEPETQQRAQSLEWRVRATDHDLAWLPAAPVRQVALNLLLNASAAAPSGGHVGLEVTGRPGAVTLSISDDGPGLATSDAERLLSSGPLPQGGGVGLRLVHDIVAALGGTIRPTRNDGRTVIDVSFPAPETGDA